MVIKHMPKEILNCIVLHASCHTMIMNNDNFNQKLDF